MEISTAGWDEVQALQRLREQHVLRNVACSLLQVFDILNMSTSPPAEQPKQRSENIQYPDLESSGVFAWPKRTMYARLRDLLLLFVSRRAREEE